MYIPAHFEEKRLGVLHALMRARPLATFVTQSASGLDANPIPLHLSAEEGEFGTLRGHIARANPLWQELVSGAEALAIFHGAESYVSPSWYPSKAEHGRAVPTWNYVTVQTHGVPRVIEDRAWLRAQLGVITAASEAHFAAPWQIADAPQDFIERMMVAIVGVEIVITRLSGKWKVSQNQPAANRAGVAAGLRARQAEEMAALVAAKQE